jgi:hypothetical protein
MTNEGNKPRIRIEIPAMRRGMDNREAYRKFVEEGEETPEPETLETTVSGSVTSLAEHWEIPNVEYRNGIYTVRLAKSLLDNGNAKKQSDWIEYSKQARRNGDFYVGNMALQYSIFRALSLQTNPESLEARDFIKKSMREKWLATTTRLKYDPSGNDEVIHDYGMPIQLKIGVELVGPDRFVDTNDSNVLNALLLDKDIARVNSVFNFLNGTNAYIWRLNSKPKKTDERVARFFAYSDWAYLGCDWDPDITNSCLGVFAVAQGADMARGQESGGGKKI